MKIGLTKRMLVVVLVIAVLVSGAVAAWVFMQIAVPQGGALEDPYSYDATSVVQTSDGGFVIAGYAQLYVPLNNSGGVPDYSEHGPSGVFLVKTDANGRVLWKKTYGGTAGSWLAKTSDGGYAITGETSVKGVEVNAEVLLIKTDANGNMLWNKTYGGFGWSDDQTGYSVVQTNDGGYAISGRPRDGWSGWGGMLLVKTDANGNQLWQKTYGGTGEDYGYSLVQTGDGGYAIAGYTWSVHGLSGLSNVFLVKTDANGNLLWNKTYGGTGGDTGRWLVQTSDGGYAVVGYTYPLIGPDESGPFDVLLVKTDANGNQLWQTTYPRNRLLEPFPTLLVVTVSATVGVMFGVGLLVYFKKRKRLHL